MRALATLWVLIGGPASAAAVAVAWPHIQLWVQIGAVAVLWLWPVGWLLEQASNKHDHKV